MVGVILVYPTVAFNTLCDLLMSRSNEESASALNLSFRRCAGPEVRGTSRLFSIWRACDDAISVHVRNLVYAPIDGLIGIADTSQGWP